MQDHSAVTLWPSVVVIDIDNRDVLNASLLPLLLDVFNNTSTGSEHYERIPHNIFEMNEPPIQELKNILVSIARFHYDIGDNFEIDGHEIVSFDRQFIKTHVDSDEGDLTLQYFVKAPQENQEQPVNKFGNASFVLVNPAQPSGSFRFKEERPSEYPLLPRDGLVVMYRSHIPHYQCPYKGDEPMVQVVCNIKIKRTPH
jgi:hypothetical protein